MTTDFIPDFDRDGFLAQADGLLTTVAHVEQNEEILGMTGNPGDQGARDAWKRLETGVEQLADLAEAGGLSAEEAEALVRTLEERNPEMMEEIRILGGLVKKAVTEGTI